MARRRPDIAAVASITAFAILLLLVLSATGPVIRRSYAIASPPQAPSWLAPGDYVEYNQTYTIGGLTASINVKDTVLATNGAADMRVERFGPQVPTGFPEPGIVAPYDTANESQLTTVVTTFANGSRSTSVGSGSTFTTDLTMFVTEDLVARTNATLDAVHVPDPGSPAVQAWRVDETALSRFIGGAVPSGAPVNPSLVWFEKDTLMKVRESFNYTDDNHNYVVSVEKMKDTNIPQLKSALTSQGSYSYSFQSSTSLSSSSVTSATGRSPDYSFWAAALVVAVAVTIAATAFYFARANRHV